MKSTFLHVFEKVAVVSITVGLLLVLPQAVEAQVSNGGAAAIGVGAFAAGTLLGPSLFSGLTAGGNQTAAQLASQVAGSNAIDLECTPVITQCGCGMTMQGTPPKCTSTGNKTNMNQCPCTTTVNGFSVKGLCENTNICQGTPTQAGAGGSGGLSSSLSNLLTATMIASLINGMVNNNSAATAPAPATTAIAPTVTTTGCTGTYYQSAVQSSDPCAIYTPSLNTTNGSSNAAQNLLNSLGNSSTGVTSTTTGTTVCPQLDTSCPTGFTYQASTQTDANGCALAGLCVATSNTASTQNTCPSVTASCSAGYTSEPQSGTDQNGCQLPNICVVNNPTTANVESITLSSTTALAVPSASSPDLAQPLAGQGGVSGNIQVTSTGTTFFATTQNSNNNSETASFIGSDTTNGTAPQGIIANWCTTQPWTTNFLSYIIPPSFFNSLCSLGGYQVGGTLQSVVANGVVNAAAPTSELQQVVQEAPPSTPAQQTQTPPAATQPSVEIWAVPASVSIGQRTSIFWNTQGVVSCTETSPDGSFSQNSLSGGASTVPLSSATTYTISCLDPNNNPVTSYVTVNIGS